MASRMIHDGCQLNNDAEKVCVEIWRPLNADLVI